MMGERRAKTMGGGGARMGSAADDDCDDDSCGSGGIGDGITGTGAGLVDGEMTSKDWCSSSSRWDGTSFSSKRGWSRMVVS